MRASIYLILLLGILLPFAVVGSTSARNRNRDQPQVSTYIQSLLLRNVRTMNGYGNNPSHPTWGMAGTPYTRTAPPNYADGKSAMVDGPDPRYVSNRIFNDANQNVFSENGVTQWAWTWGQFLDHTFGLRDENGDAAMLPFNADDPMEDYVNDYGVIDFSRSAAAPGTGVRNPRQQINTVSSFIDAWAVYGGDKDRLEWLREGPVDGDMSNNGPHLLLTADGYLPTVGERGDTTKAPNMALMGRLQGQPELARVAGDVRANENLALTAVQTLFAREHNRIVDELPTTLSSEVRFQIARAIVIAEQQYITYEQWLPDLGIQLDRYRGYDKHVNPSISNEFATAAYRAHSMIHGEFEMEGDKDNYTPETLAAFEHYGIEVEDLGDEVEMVVPLNVAFGNPDLVQYIGLDSALEGLGGEPQYKNDEMIDNQLRSVLFQVPGPGVSNPSDCLDGPKLPDCFSVVLDLGAIDLERGRDHGIATYNQLRRAYGLRPVTNFKQITGESTESFPSDPEITGNPMDDPSILDFMELTDNAGNILPAGTEAGATNFIRRTTVAARLKGLYGNVNSVDAFAGLLAEKHVAGTEMGPTMLAIWKAQFENLRDGDRFFYRDYSALDYIQRYFGIDFRHSLSDIIEMNTGMDSGSLPADIFKPGFATTSLAAGGAGGEAPDLAPVPTAAPATEIPAAIPSAEPTGTPVAVPAPANEAPLPTESKAPGIEPGAVPAASPTPAARDPREVIATDARRVDG